MAGPNFLASWRTSEYRTELGPRSDDNPARRARGEAYLRFMDSFYQNLDTAYSRRPPGTVGETLQTTQAAFQAAMRAHGAEIRRHGVTPRLLLEGSVRTGAHPQSIDEINISTGNVAQNVEAQRVLRANPSDPYIVPANLNVQFSAGPGNYRYTTVVNLGDQRSLEMTTPVGQAGFRQPHGQGSFDPAAIMANPPARITPGPRPGG